MARRITGPKYYAARGEETTGPFLESWRAFQRNNERYRPGLATRQTYTPCLIANIAHGRRREGCLQWPCAACRFEPEGDRLFDHEEAWHLLEGSRRHPVRLAHPYLSPERITQELTRLFDSMPREAAKELIGYIGPPDDDWYMGPMTTGFLVQNRAFPGPTGWMAVGGQTNALAVPRR